MPDSPPPPAPGAAAAPSVRDLRLDFFRGLALWFIFIDHVPSSALGNLTFRNLGFSDATEIFVFISGYTAALVYGGSLVRRGAPYMVAQVARRCWQLYVAHIVLFVFYIAQVAWVSDRFSASPFVEEMNISRFFDEPRVAIFEALALQYRPVNLDVLPLYIALLVSLPAWLLIARRAPWVAGAISLALWGGVQAFHWAAPVYANGDVWTFNPLGWQLLFVIGVLCALSRGDDSRWWKRWHGWVAALCVAWLAVAAVIALSWKLPALGAVVTPRVEGWLYPIDKTDLDAARVLHFLAFAWLASQLIGPQSRLLRSPLARPAILCGQHSLQVFCLGISLSFVAHAVLLQFGRSAVQEGLVMASGIGILVALAMTMDWFSRRAAKRTRPAGAA